MAQISRLQKKRKHASHFLLFSEIKRKTSFLIRLSKRISPNKSPNYSGYTTNIYKVSTFLWRSIKDNYGNSENKEELNQLIHIKSFYKYQLEEGK